MKQLTLMMKYNTLIPMKSLILRLNALLFAIAAAVGIRSINLSLDLQGVEDTEPGTGKQVRKGAINPGNDIESVMGRCPGLLRLVPSPVPPNPRENGLI